MVRKKDRQVKQQLAHAEPVDHVAPLPLRRAMTEAAPFPVGALGKLLGDAAKAIMDKVQCPDALAGQSVLGAAALAAQAHADVRHPVLGTARPLSLFLVTIAASGERKSAADALALEPVRLREHDLREKFEAAAKAYRDEQDIHQKLRDAALRLKKESKDEAIISKAARDELAKNAAKLPAPPARPLLPLLTVAEPTLEGLHRLLAEGEPSIGLFSDEGGMFIGGHAMSDDARLRTATGLCALWDGQPVKRSRGAETATMMYGRRVSLHLMAQPGIADGLLSHPLLVQQGLPSRLLVAAPDSLVGTRFQRALKSGTQGALDRYTKHLMRLLKEPQKRAGLGNQELRPRLISLTAEAAKLWSDYADECERGIANGAPLEPIRSLANKLPEHALRIAAVFELVDSLTATNVRAETMDRAISLARYYAGEALRQFDEGVMSPEMRRAERLLKWLHERNKEVVRLVEIYQGATTDLRTAAAAREAAAILERYHWLRPIPGGVRVDGKRWKDAWEVVQGDAA